MLTKKQPIVLIVDDIHSNVILLAETLKNDYLIKIASNGEESIRIAQKTPHPDLILMDVNMPVMDGFEVCRKLKSIPETYNIPVIFVTALTEERNEELGFNVGGVDYISKPFSRLS